MEHVRRISAHITSATAVRMLVAAIVIAAVPLVVGLTGIEQSELRTPSAPPTSQTEQPVQHPQFKNCDEARAAGRTHIPRSDPDYQPALDPDNDGFACDVGEPTR